MNIISNQNTVPYVGSKSIFFVKSPIDFFVRPRAYFTVRTGIKVAINENEVLRVVSNPTLERNYGLKADEIYFPSAEREKNNGFVELFIRVHNLSKVSHSVKAGDEIALLVPLLTTEVTELNVTPAEDEEE